MSKLCGNGKSLRLSLPVFASPGSKQEWNDFDPMHIEDLLPDNVCESCGECFTWCRSLCRTLFGVCSNVVWMLCYSDLGNVDSRWCM